MASHQRSSAKKKSPTKLSTSASPRQTTSRLSRTTAKAGTKQTTPCVRFAGLSLGGGKTHKTAVTVLEYYPKHQKLFVRGVHSHLGPQSSSESSDLGIHKLLSQTETKLKYIAVDAPLSLPKCMRCVLKCPGYEKCREPEIRWMWKFYEKNVEQKKRPLKIFTPYTERCVDNFLSHEAEEGFHSDHALGANRAPLAARAQFITRRLGRLNFIEFHPRLTLWRLGRNLGVQKSYLKFYRHSQDSEQGRHHVLSRMIEANWIFMYQQDLKLAVESPQVFEAILGGITGFLKYRGQTEDPPEGFPQGESWVEYPIDNLEWFPKKSERGR